MLAAVLAGAGLGLLVAGAVIGIWWGVDGRHHPKAAVGEAGAISATLVQAPSVLLSGGKRPVYVIGLRESAGFEQWATAEVYELAALGRQVRVIAVPSEYGGWAEQATIAQLWLHPERDTLEAWLAPQGRTWTADGIPAVMSDVYRQEALMKARTFAERVSAHAGVRDAWPLVFWQDASGVWMVCVCDNASANARARAALGLSARHQPFVADHVAAPPPLAAKVPVTVQSQPQPQDANGHPYPVDFSVAPVETTDTSEIEEPLEARGMAPAPRLPGDAPEPTSEGPVAVTRPAAGAVTRRPAASAPARRPQPRVANTEPPRAEKNEEALFY